MFCGKPIIGLAGGIGSGKSFVAALFAELGCAVISSDDLVTQAYRDPMVMQTLRGWWGDRIFGSDQQIDRAAVARKIFSDPGEKVRLESLLHPLVSQARQRLMEARAGNAQMPAFVWDTPLLFETELNRLCDAVVFVDAPESSRLQRVREKRNWGADELGRREILQMPLDKKQKISDYVISNAAGTDQVRAQVREVLSRILAGLTPMAGCP